jgi:hypothetical protein
MADPTRLDRPLPIDPLNETTREIAANGITVSIAQRARHL